MPETDPLLNDYSLMLYTCQTQGAATVGDITRIADVWRRSTRFQGGYWRGSFRVNSEDQSLSKWFSQYKGYKIREYVGPTLAWEGLIYAMKYGGGGSYLDVNVAGYVYTANWRFVTCSTNTAGNASGWIRDIVDTDCEFLSPGKIETNAAAQVYRGGDPVGRAWEEILKVAELGDASGNIWRFWVGNDQLAHYRQQNMTPLYLVYAGMEREWTYEELRNYVTLTYTDEDDEEHTLDATTGQQAQSIARHGRFEERLTMDKVASDGAESYQKTFLTEHAWPWARPTGAKAGLTMLDRNLSPVHPRLVQPGVVRDLAHLVKGKEPGSVFEDARDFLMDEVEVNQKSGLSIRTAWADEAELIAAQEEYDNWMDQQLTGRDARKKPEDFEG